MKQTREWNRRSFVAAAGLAVLSSGCGVGVLPAQAQPAEASREAYEKKYDELHARNPELYPTRVSRGFFDQSIEGKVTIRDSGTGPVELASRVAWQEEPTTLAPPEGEYLADFRDYQACAVYEELSGTKLCFDVAPDVSTIDLSEQRMRPDGIQQLLAANSGCTVALQNLKFLDAKKVDGGFDVFYIAQAQAQPGCSIQTGPVVIEMSLRQP